MTDEEILDLVQHSLYGYNYILDRDNKNDRSTYIQTVIEDIKYNLKHDKK